MMNVSANEQPGRTSKESTRTCVGCGEKDAPTALVRLVLGPDAAVAVDVSGGAFGRGAHVHSTRTCIEKAPGGLSRAFKAEIRVKAEELVSEIVAAFDRRLIGLALAANRKGSVALGHESALDAIKAGAPLLVVACDAGSVVSRTEVTAVVARGDAAVWGDKASLGSRFGRDEIALFAVTDRAIAQEMKHCFATVASLSGSPRSREVTHAGLGRSDE